MNENKVPSQYDAGVEAGLNLAIRRIIEAGVEINKQIVAAILGCNAEAESEALKNAKETENRWFEYYCERGKKIEALNAEIEVLKAKLNEQKEAVPEEVK